MIPRSLLYVSIALILTGCGEASPKIDGTSNVAFQASVENISASLGDSAREEFFRALGTIAGNLVDQTDKSVLASAGPMEMTQLTTQKLRVELDGYSAADVIHRAKTIRDRRE